MKKIISLVLMLAMVLSATVVFTSAHKDGGSIGTVPATTASIVVDGVMDEAYNNALFVNVADELLAIYNPANPTFHASAKAYLLVSNDYKTLYIFASVTDEDQVLDWTTDVTAREDRPAVCAWMHDGFEVFLDPSNSHTVSITVDEDGYPREDKDQTSGLYQYRQELNGTQTSGNGNNSNSATALNSIFKSAVNPASRRTYNVEFAIDLSALESYEGYPIAQAGKEIGFIMMINDKLSDAALLNNITSSQLIPYGEANSPSVWASQDWPYIVLGTAEDKGNAQENLPTSDATVPNTGSASTGGAQTANKAADGIAVAAGLLVLSAAGAVVLTKKRR